VENNWWAQLKLPNGAIVDYVGVDACDDNATGAILFGLARTTAGSAVPGSNVTPLGTTGVAATPGCGLFSVGPASQLFIDNNTYNYWLFLDFSAFSSNLKVAGFIVRYRLQVSPAPGSASFNDVPTGHQYFQFIEALKASAITTGCQASPPLYCPDAPLTRGQMAVFLARALGLHWPN
jgi:hypothetical protein